MNRLSLNSIRTFSVAAKTLSFKKAAAELFVTPGAVSRQVSALESYLGVPLFERHFREVSLTNHGLQYAQEISHALDDIEMATQRLLSLGARPKLRIESAPTFALHWLIPRLADFKRHHPNIDVSLTTSSQPIQEAARFDVFIRRDPKQFPGMKGVALMTEYSQLVCSPEVWRKWDSIEAVLAEEPLLHIKTREDLWPKWLGQNGIELRSKDSDVVMENTIFAIQAVVEGLGVAVVPTLFLSELMQSGSLVSPQEGAATATGQYYHIGSEKGENETVDQFTAWLKQRCARDTD